MTCQAVYLAPWMNFNTLTWTRYRVLRSLVRYRVEHSRESPYNNCTTSPLNFTVLNKRIDWLMDGLIDWLENNAWHYKNRCHWTLKNVIYWLFQASIRKCLNCVHNCDDHSLLDFKSAVQYMKHLKYHFTLKYVQTFRAEPFIKKPIVASWHTPYEKTNGESALACNVRARETQLWNWNVWPRVCVTYVRIK